MMVCRIDSPDTSHALPQPSSSGSRPGSCQVVSSANTTDMNSARDAPAKIAAMPTSAASPGARPSCGKASASACPSVAPRQAPTVINGASVPPEVPLPSATVHDSSLAAPSSHSASPRPPPASASVMLS
ncbi:hypothetical protein GALL_379000 [mine drainage metagenome]|uniref:Uncharacterized protein n=1 Tax=mine drainage metagenome TaxID=410659 RepID=A0A1J5QK52_9ZZZZ